LKKIIIIGAGQLGSRHLQSIAQSSFGISIEVVEPFESARVIAKERYEEIEDKKFVSDIQFYSSIKDLSSDIDMAIIATGADVRFKVVKELLESKKVSNLVLEKVLFQTLDEYTMMESILEKMNTKCWVNHPRRMFPTYHMLKKELKGANQVSYNFQGGNWGLGCNALHFIDHLAFLVNSTNIEINNSYLDNKIYQSKRKGFVEFNGLLTGKIDNHTFSLYSNKDDTPSLFSITSDNLTAKINESEGQIILATKKNNWKEEIINDKIVYYQSELSSILIREILIDESCQLPTYKEAKNLHIPFIETLLQHMNKVNGQDNKICPIT